MLKSLIRLSVTFALTLIANAEVLAADVTVTPAASSGFVVKDAAGANERMRVQESGAITFPGVPGAAAQSTALCMSGVGLLGPCSGGGLGATYTASTGLSLAGTAFSVAPTYQLPQGCAANQIAQWSGAAWACADVGAGATLPAGTFDQTLRYNSSNTLVANSMLLAFSDGGLLATGTFPGTIPATGAGTRMMWYPSKEAFRAGHVGGTEWDDANIGASSIAMGRNAKASGDSSVALGASTTASGDASVAIGVATSASGGDALAMGDSTTASGLDSTAMGGSTTAGGDYSTAMGGSTTANGDYSTAMGNATTASGKNSTAMGHAATASGGASTAIGENVTASGDNSVAIGTSASTNGHRNSFAWGDGTVGVQNDADQQFLVTANGGVKVTTFVEVDGSTALNEIYDYIVRGTSHDGIDDGFCNGCLSHPAVYAPNGYMMALEFDVLSDARIKDIAGVSDSARDLATLNSVQITDYTMKDKARYGNRHQKKVIAQQIEQVFPQLVTTHTDFIPDVYKLANRIESVEGGYKLGFDKPHGLAKSAKKLKLLPEGKSVFEQVDVLAVPSDREVIVQASGWTAERVFVYGEQVDDLRTVDYDGLSALNVSATQELSKRLGIVQVRQTELAGELADKDARLAALQDTIATQQRQLVAQGEELGAQRERIAAMQAQAGEIAALKAAVEGLQRKPAEILLTDVHLQP